MSRSIHNQWTERERNNVETTTLTYSFLRPINGPMWAPKPYRDAVAIQRLITDASKEASAKDLAALGKTFVSLEMLKLRLRMKPAPKPVDVTKLKTEKQQLAVNGEDFTEG